MGCIYSSFGGKCQNFDENFKTNGCDEEGFCVCEDDPDPGYSCEEYESDWICNECGADLNIEECDCEK